MDFIQKPPDALLNNVPEGVRTFLENGGWYAVLGVGGLIILWILWAILRSIVGAFSRPAKMRSSDAHLWEDVRALPAPPPLTGDRRLLVEGVPVRLRLVVFAPAGRGYDINPAAFKEILERVLPGLGQIAEDDQPKYQVWPHQLSYEGFANSFHKHTPIPEGDDEPSPWVMVAGRAHLGKQQVLLGLGLLAVKPTTLGRLHLQMHEWPNKLRVRTRE